MNPVLLDVQLVDVMEVVKIVGRDIETVGTHGPAGWVHLVDVDGAGVDLFCLGLGSGRCCLAKHGGEQRGKENNLFH